MGAIELVQGLGRALAVLREAGASQQAVQALEDDVTALDAAVFRDSVEAERAAARLVARLYGIDPAVVAAYDPLAEPATPAEAPVAAEPAPEPVPAEAVSAPPEPAAAVAEVAAAPAVQAEPPGA